MFNPGEIIDGKYHVHAVCSNLGGMGTILHVESLNAPPPFALVLKYCKAADEESKTRFRREVRYLASLAGNSMVVQVLDSNLAMDPPYFVMKYYPEGDSSGLASRLQGDIAFQELVFNKMLSCIAELHARGFQHRDIKPQNFLVEGDAVIVSDLGLAKEVGAGTTFTMSHEYWGTLGFLPPEFLVGGFKVASPPSDIFMMGKTFYTLLSGRDPIYLTDLGLHPAIYNVIERCCHMKPENRYSTISDLRQDLKLAYDVILGRAKGIGTAQQMLSQIVSGLNAEQKYVADEINAFLDLLAKLPDDERASIVFDIPQNFFYVLAQAPIAARLDKFLDQYEVFTQSAVSTWSYAETVAANMKIIFNGSSNTAQRAKSLEIAIEGAVWANRFAAMDTCINMITNVVDDKLGLAVSAIIARHRGTFIDGIETSRCKNDAVRNAIRVIQNSGS